MLFPATEIVPSTIGNNPIAARPTVVFPEPDSPTRPTISPGKISRLKSVTARNAGTRPFFGYSIETFSSFSTGGKPTSSGFNVRTATDPSLGTAASNCCVYGCFGLLKIWSAVPYSTVFPSFMTRMSSAKSATTPIS